MDRFHQWPSPGCGTNGIRQTLVANSDACAVAFTRDFSHRVLVHGICSNPSAGRGRVRVFGTMRRALGVSVDRGRVGSAGAAGLAAARSSTPSASRSSTAAVRKKGISKGPRLQKARSKTAALKKDISKAPKCEKDISTRFPASHWAMPSALAAKLDNWGPPFVRGVRECGRVALAKQGILASWPTRDQLHVGTDCSGAEAPVWALHAMGITHVHKFSCDIQPSVRQFIQATSPPQGPIYEDMLAREIAEMPAHSIYCCGFPCKAFSLLRRHSTRLLKEASAKPFFAVLRVIRHHMPLVAVLENVRGLRTVFAQVFAHLKKIPGYFIFVLPMDSTDLGEPISRPRYYFICVRQDVAVSSDVSFLSNLVKNMYSTARSDVLDHVSQRLLPANSPAVQQVQGLKRSRSVACGRAGVQASEFGLAPRQQALLQAARRTCQKTGGKDVIIDVSQSEGRTPLRFNGISPTLTPGACVVVDRAKRVIIPIEKLMLHGFPIHRMKIPTCTSNTELASLGGNTMHVKCVGLALLMGIVLVNWNHRSARPEGQPFQGAQFPATSIVLPFEASHQEAPKAKSNRRRTRSQRIARGSTRK